MGIKRKKTGETDYAKNEDKKSGCEAFSQNRFR